MLFICLCHLVIKTLCHLVHHLINVPLNLLCERGLNFGVKSVLQAELSGYFVALVLLTSEDYYALCWEVVAEINCDANDFISTLSLIIDLVIENLRIWTHLVKHAVLVLKFKFFHVI